jgi:hypothetical protein
MVVFTLFYTAGTCLQANTTIKVEGGENYISVRGISGLGRFWMHKFRRRSWLALVLLSRWLWGFNASHNGQCMLRGRGWWWHNRVSITS